MVSLLLLNCIILIITLQKGSHFLSGFFGLLLGVLIVLIVMQFLTGGVEPCNCANDKGTSNHSNNSVEGTYDGTFRHSFASSTLGC